MPQGSIVTRVYTSDAYLPLRGIPVVYTTTGNGHTETLLALRWTDSSGLTEPYYISTPDADQSLSPNHSEQPYAVINIRVSAPGYNAAAAENVQIFPGVRTIQGFQLRPVATAQDDPSVTYNEPPQNL